MKLLIEKLGRIEHAELEIRPLTVFVGKNNTNKTWSAYALHGLLQYLTWRKPAMTGVRSMGTSLMKIQTETVRRGVLDAVEREVARLPPPDTADTVELEVSRRGLLAAIEEPAEFHFRADPLRKLLGLEEEIADGARATLRVPAEDLRRRDATVSMQLGYTQRSLRMHWIAGEPEIALSVQLNSTAPVEKLRERAADLLRAFAQRFLSMGVVLVLPAERKALVTAYKPPEDDGARAEVMSRPVSAYVNFLATTDTLWRTRKDTAMPDALGHLDQRILGGAVEFQGNESGQRMVFVPHRGPALPMHATSSLVRSLAGLDLYLRYVAREGDTLIIDEPEMNAHPDAQVRLVELLAGLVKQGIRVILTTHSPYIVDHINNLIWAGKLASKDQEEVAEKLALGTRECLLRGEDVAAYLFEAEGEEAPVRVKPIFEEDDEEDDPEGMIDWETFSRTSRYLSDLYASEILPRLYRKE